MGGITYFNHVSTNCANFLQITTHFVVEESKPISNPENEMTPSFGHSVDIDNTQNALCGVRKAEREMTEILLTYLSNVHSSRGFESIITIGVRLDFQKGNQLFFLNNLLSHTLDESHSFFQSEATLNEI